MIPLASFSFPSLRKIDNRPLFANEPENFSSEKKEHSYVFRNLFAQKLYCDQFVPIVFFYGKATNCGDFAPEIEFNLQEKDEYKLF